MPPRRFTIRRVKIGWPDSRPWKLRDRTAPSFIGQYKSHAWALVAMENRARRDLGLPPILAITTEEIRKAMGTKR
jgi:hypothetical protein